MKVAILGNPYFSHLFVSYGIESIILYKQCALLRKLLIFMRKFNPSFMKGAEYRHNWIDPYINYDVIIVFDYSFTSGDYAGLEYIMNRVSKETRLIYYHWNLISDNIEMQKTLLLPRWEHWTFDVNEAKKYAIKFANTFYMKEFVSDSGSDILYDAFFVGVDKPVRRNQIKSIQNLCRLANLRTLFYIVKYNSIFSRKMLTYEDTVKYAKKSKAIIEILKTNQVGLSLRTMEAIFLNKKLITNNMEIKRYSFYDERNVYLLSKDERSLTDFLCDNTKMDYTLARKEYLFDKWVERIINNEEAVI